ncbi:hypothetical protein LCL61_16075 [Amycolatopsis coloradensis]|uniref:Uncharacterized protein n=1 Tax=Amycolatopsis coloradensis TaxID=76021 RepID=A0ACD5BCF4_9PSEU
MHDAVKDVVAGYLANGLSEQDAERLAEELATKLGTAPAALPGSAETGAGLSDESRLADFGESPRRSEPEPFTAVAQMEDVVRWRPDPVDAAGPRTFRAYVDTLVLPEGIYFDKAAVLQLNNNSMAWLRAWAQGLAAEKDSEGRWRYKPKEILALGGEGLFSPHTVTVWIREARGAVVDAGAARAGVGGAHLAPAAAAKKEDVARWRPDPVNAVGPRTLRAYLDTVTLPKGVFFDRTTTKLNDAARDWLQAWVQGMAAEKDSEGRWLYSTGEILALGGEGLLKRRTTQKWISAVRQPVVPAQPLEESGGLGSPAEAPSDRDVVGDAVHGSADRVSRVPEIGDERGGWWWWAFAAVRRGFCPGASVFPRSGYADRVAVSSGAGLDRESWAGACGRCQAERCGEGRRRGVSGERTVRAGR